MTRRVAELADARASEARAPEAWEFESPPGDSLLSRRAGARPGLISPACPDRYRGLGLAGGPVPGRLSYARTRRFDSPTRNCLSSRHGTLTGIAARSRAWCLWVRIPPVLLPRIVPSSSGEDACLTHRIAQVRVLPGRLPAFRSAGVPAAHLLGREGDRVRFSGGPLSERADRSSRDKG